MKKINEAIELAERLQDEIESHDMYYDLFSDTEREERSDRIDLLADELASMCEELLPMGGVSYYDLLPTKTAKVIELLYMYRKLIELAA